jgi:hypothetical protein
MLALGLGWLAFLKRNLKLELANIPLLCQTPFVDMGGLLDEV